MTGRETLVVTDEPTKGLESVGLGEQLDVSTKELPFVMHLGIARGSRVVMLEQTGKNRGYRDKDVCGFCPERRCCMDTGPETLCSVVNMRAVSKQFQKEGIDVVYSGDAGRYLCDFAYDCTLHHRQGRAALVHLPHIWQPGLLRCRPSFRPCSLSIFSKSTKGR